MRSFLQGISRLAKRPPAFPRVFNNPNFERISRDQIIEEETFPDYLASRYYPVHIGEVFATRYQVVGKLGYGAFSTVWLARDLNQHRHVALKIFIYSQAMGSKADHELDIYNHMAKVSSTCKHEGRNAARILLGSFKVKGEGGEHHRLVHPPLWDNIETFLRRNPVGRLPTPALGIVLYRLFLALDFLHMECNLIHTDIKADNIMFGAADNTVFRGFEIEELENPSSRKDIDEKRLIYVSRGLNIPKDYNPPVLCDFGSAISRDKTDAQNVVPLDIY